MNDQVITDVNVVTDANEESDESHYIPQSTPQKRTITNVIETEQASICLGDRGEEEVENITEQDDAIDLSAEEED